MRHTLAKLVFVIMVLLVTVLWVTAAYAKKVCPIDGKRFSDKSRFCPTHGVKLINKGDKKIFFQLKDGSSEVMKFKGFNTDCDGYGDEGIKYSEQGVAKVIPWQDVHYILPRYGMGVLKSGDLFETENLKPSSCRGAEIRERKIEQVDVLGDIKNKEVELRITLKKIEVIAFNIISLDEGAEKYEAKKDEESRKAMHVRMKAEAQRKQQAEADRLQAEARSKRQAEAEAMRKAAAEAKRKQAEAAMQVPEEPTVVVPESVKRKWSSVMFSIENKQTKQTRDVSINLNSEYSIPNTTLKVIVGDFLPDFVMRGSIITSASAKPNHPAVRIIILDNGKELYRDWLYSKFPALNPFEHNVIAITLKQGVR